MDINLNAAYLKNIYNPGQAVNRPELPYYGRSSNLDFRNNRDSAVISEEARRLQDTRQVAGSNERAVDQLNDMYKPGFEQPILRSERSLEVPQAVRSERPPQPPAQDPPEGLDTLREDESLYRVQQQQSERNRQPAPPRPTSSDDLVDVFREVQNLRGANANINSFNTSSMLQAYGAAANVLQASMVVNYKV